MDDSALPPFLGERLGEIRDQWTAGLLLASLPVARGTAVPLAGLSEAVRAAAAAVRGAGFRPAVVLVPGDDAAAALAGRGARCAEDGRYDAEFEGLRLQRWPASDAAVLDDAAALALTEDGTQVELLVLDAGADLRGEMAVAARAATTAEGVPGPDDVRVTIEAALRAPVAVVRPAAGVRIPVVRGG